MSLSLVKHKTKEDILSFVFIQWSSVLFDLKHSSKYLLSWKKETQFVKWHRENKWYILCELSLDDKCGSSEVSLNRFESTFYHDWRLVSFRCVCVRWHYTSRHWRVTPGFIRLTSHLWCLVALRTFELNDQTMMCLTVCEIRLMLRSWLSQSVYTLTVPGTVQ